MRSSLVLLHFGVIVENKQSISSDETDRIHPRKQSRSAQCLDFYFVPEIHNRQIHVNLKIHFNEMMKTNYGKYSVKRDSFYFVCF